MNKLWHFLRCFAKLVVLPTLIALLFVAIVAWRSGADVVYSVDRVAELQHSDSNILWTGPGQFYGPLALARIKLERPEIIMIGHSRCGQMRSMMFKPYSFHNACVVAWTFGQIRNIIDLATRSGNPKTILFTLDYFMLGDRYAQRWEEKAFMDFEAPRRPRLDGDLALSSAFSRRPLTMLREMPSFLFGWAREPVDGLKLLGPAAIVGQGGIRSDGSLLYDPVTRSEAPVNRTELARILATVSDGDGVHPGSSQMKELEAIGQLGKERNLTIVGIQLPLIQSAVDVLDSDKDWSQYKAADRGNWRLLRSFEMHEYLKKLGIHFVDMTSDPIARESRAFIDPAHPSEYATGTALFDTMNNNAEFRSLFPQLNLMALDAALVKAKQRNRFFDVYGDRF